MTITGRRSRILTTVLGKIDHQEWAQGDDGRFWVWMQPKELYEFTPLVGNTYDIISIRRYLEQVKYDNDPDEIRSMCRELMRHGECNQLLLEIHACEGK